MSLYRAVVTSGDAYYSNHNIATRPVPGGFVFTLDLIKWAPLSTARNCKQTNKTGCQQLCTGVLD
jgi:hypothetical protein